MMSKTNTSIFTHNANKPQNEISWNVGLGENHRQEDVAHPFAYTFLNSHPINFQQQIKQIVKGDQISLFSNHMFGVKEEAISPDEILRLYFVVLKVYLKNITFVGDEIVNNPNIKASYKKLPNFDDVYRIATRKEFKESIVNLYQYKCREGVSSLLQSYVFIEEMVGSVVAAVFKDVKYDDFSIKIDKFLNNTNKENKACVKEVKNKLCFSESEELQHDIEERYKVEKNEIKKEHLNQNIEIQVLRKLFEFDTYLLSKDLVCADIRESFYDLMYLLGDEDEDRWELFPILREELKRSHKSFYTPNQLIFIK